MSDFDFGMKPKDQVEEPEIVEESGLPAVQIIDTQPALLKLMEFQKEVQELLADARAITVVQDDFQNSRAISAASKLKSKRKRIEAVHHHFTFPLWEAKKQLDNWFNQFEDPMEVEEKRLGRQSGSYRLLLEQERRRKEAEAKKQQADLQRKLDAEAAASKKAGKPFEAVTVVAPIIPETPKTIRTEDGAATLRHEWRFEVVDASLIERRFLVIDEQAIRREIRGGLRESPGLRIYESGTTNIRV